MPLGIVSDQEFEAEIKFIEDPLVGRPKGRIEVPQDIRKIVASEAIQGARARELSEAFGVSPSSISAYKHGSTSTSTYHEPDPDLKAHVDSTRLTIRDSARQRLIEALSHITPEKLKDAKLRDVASVAKDLSIVASNNDVADKGGPNGNVQFHFHVTPTKAESDFEVIDVTS